MFTFWLAAVPSYKDFCLSPSKEICKELLQSRLFRIGGPNNFDWHFEAILLKGCVVSQE